MVNINIERDHLDSLRNYLNKSPVYIDTILPPTYSELVRMVITDIVKFDRITEMTKRNELQK